MPKKILASHVGFAARRLLFGTLAQEGEILGFMSEESGNAPDAVGGLLHEKLSR